MDENVNAVVENVEPVAEAEEVEGLTSEEEAMWDNDDYDDFAEDSDNVETEVDQPETENVGQTAEQTEPVDAAQVTDQFLELKHLGEVRKVGKEEATSLAQMGMDYPRIKGKLAEANMELDRLRKYEEFLGEMKGNYGSIDELIVDTRARVISEKENIPIEQARAKIAQVQTKQAEQPQESPIISSEKQSLTLFTELYPNVKAKDIPQEVWDDMKSSTHNLIASWERYQSKTTAKENEVLKQNEKNKTRSTGSMKSSGTATRDEIDTMWYEDDY